MIDRFHHAIQQLEEYIFQNKFNGYDPYDILNSSINFNLYGKWGPVIAIQIHKRNPINLRHLIRIEKGINPKAMGLLLKAYSLLFSKTHDPSYSKKSKEIFDWLNQNYTPGFAGKCWGYNFSWASSDGYLPAYTPSVVVTSFVVDGVFEYYKATKDSAATELIADSAKYITHDIPIIQLPKGISFSYTHLSQGCCYNASLLAAEILAKSDFLTQDYQYQESINSCIDFIISRQKKTGEWWYSYNPESGNERRQIDFHQGFILVSLNNLFNLIKSQRHDIEVSIKKGLDYYHNVQFHKNGRSNWRIPKKWPVDIHNQSQGIITFSKLNRYNADYLDFAKTIASWTIQYMQSNKGYFYYRKTPLFMNKISYMRWSQAWMFLALSELIAHHD